MEVRLCSTGGSPPHTRGKPAKTSLRAALGRLTPAHAGKTRRAKLEREIGQAHPRTRGENLQTPATQSVGSGSPPHTRGKLSQPKFCQKYHRLTPAHAGKTFPELRDLSSDEAHPRTRGENLLVVIFDFFAEGSPPHTRGKQSHTAISIVSYRLTPAHAGKTEQRENRLYIRQAHPRTRGENFIRYCFVPAVTGSPPHTRGKQSKRFLYPRGCRLTPAHAGKTCTNTWDCGRF